MTVQRTLLALLCLSLLLCSSLSAQNPSATCNVRDFGAKGDGSALDTAAITRAIKACNGMGGGTVLFPPGIYVTGTFEILSNITLHLEAGAVVQGSLKIADYRRLVEFGLMRGDYGETSSGEGDLVGMIVARGAHDIAITGRGTIDGRGDDFMDLDVAHASMDFDPESTRNPKEFLAAVHDLSYGPVEPKLKGDGRPGTLLIFHECRNVLLRDVTLRDSPNWTLHLQRSEQIVISGLHIINDPRIPNNDGIDCMRCKHLHVSDCDIQTGDDDFAIVNSEHVNISNCSMTSRSAAIRLEGTRDAVFNNLTIDTNRGIGVFHQGTNDYSTDNVLFSNITMRTHLIPGHWWGKAEPIYVAIRPCEKGACRGAVQNLTFSNITANAEAGILVVGAKESPATNLTFDRVHVNIRPPKKEWAETVGGNFDLRWTASNLKEAIIKHDIPGIYCTWVKGMRVKDSSVEWGGGLPAYFSDGMQCENFSEVSIDGFEGRQAQTSGSAMNFANGSGLSVTNSKAAPGTDTFLRLDNVSDRRTFVNWEIGEAKTVIRPANVTFKTQLGESTH